MNLLTKAVMTLFMVALGVMPAVVLHADSLPPIGGGGAASPAGLGGPAPPGVAPEVVEPDPVPAEPGPVAIPSPAVEEPTWDWTRSGNEDDADALDEGEAPGPGCSWTSGCPAEEPTPGPTAAEPTEPAEDDGGLLGDLLGG